jgi:hypothetical protein
MVPLGTSADGLAIERCKGCGKCARGLAAADVGFSFREATGGTCRTRRLRQPDPSSLQEQSGSAAAARIEQSCEAGHAPILYGRVVADISPRLADCSASFAGRFELNFL